MKKLHKNWVDKPDGGAELNFGIVSVVVRRPDKATSNKKWVVQIVGQQTRTFGFYKGFATLFPDRVPLKALKLLGEKFLAETIVNDIWDLRV